MTNHDELCEKDGEKFKQNWVDVSEQSRRLVEKNEEIKELRTRVAELEVVERKKSDDGQLCMFCSVPEMMSENIELKKRVAELEKSPYRTLWDICERFNLGSSGCPDSLITKHIEELQTRLSTLEEEVEQYRQVTYGERKLPDAELHQDQAFLAFSLESDKKRLSTLLKASEGMEKALEKVIEDVVQHGNEYKERDWNPDCHLQNPIAMTVKEFREAIKALANFRAVKETMKKGAGK